MADVQITTNAGESTTLPASRPVTLIRATRGWLPIDFRELWAYRELLYFLVWSEIKVRYKQTALGAAWAVIPPFLTMVVFSVFFGRLANLESDGFPYPVFAYSALVPWTFFATGLTGAANSLLRYQGVITKVYAPRMLMPVSAVVASLVDFAISFVILIGLVLYYGITPPAEIVFLPVFIALAIATALGIGLWLSALTALYRDVRYTVPFLIQIWLFITPVAYSSTIIPDEWRFIYGLNPMAGVVTGFRWTLLGSDTHVGPLLLVSAAMVVVLLVSGAYYFRRAERTLADVV